MNDLTFRVALKKSLLAEYLERSDTAFLEELTLRHGENRLDIAIVSGIFHGFEIKSDSDNLSRLPQQVLTYNLILDQVTLVVAQCHLASALEIIPEWWGVEVANYDSKNNLRFQALRPAHNNPCVEVFYVAELLWRDEALQFLEERGYARGYRSKSRAVLHRRIVEVAAVNEIRSYVRNRLKLRKDWKSVVSSPTNAC